VRLILGLTKPRKSIIGLVLAGEIESAGKDIKRFRTGDKVYGLTGFGLVAYGGLLAFQFIDMGNSDCTWTNPMNFGPNINIGLGSWGPWVLVIISSFSIQLAPNRIIQMSVYIVSG